MESSIFRAVQILALDAVIEPTYESSYRYACRWYSKTFSTPLMQVMELPDEHVWQTFFEEHYQTLKEKGEEGSKKLDEIVQSLAVTEADQAEEQADEDEWVRQMNEEAAKDWKEEQKAKEPESDAVGKPNLEHKDIELTGEFDPADMNDPTEAE